MDPIGKSPVPWLILLLGKAAMISCWFFFVAKMYNPGSMLYDSPATRVIGVVVGFTGAFIAIISLFNLGRSVSVGIPRARTELKTHGMYQVSRNPIYLGGFLMCAGSCMFSIHPVNLLLMTVMAGVHHSIVMKEEQFLEKTFGQQWMEYAQRVPRYVGRVRRAHGGK